MMCPMSTVLRTPSSTHERLRTLPLALLLLAGWLAGALTLPWTATAATAARAPLPPAVSSQSAPVSAEEAGVTVEDARGQLLTQNGTVSGLSVAASGSQSALLYLYRCDLGTCLGLETVTSAGVITSRRQVVADGVGFESYRVVAGQDVLLVSYMPTNSGKAYFQRFSFAGKALDSTPYVLPVTGLSYLRVAYGNNGIFLVTGQHSANQTTGTPREVVAMRLQASATSPTTLLDPQEIHLTPVLGPDPSTAYALQAVWNGSAFQLVWMVSTGSTPSDVKGCRLSVQGQLLDTAAVGLGKSDMLPAVASNGTVTVVALYAADKVTATRLTTAGQVMSSGAVLEPDKLFSFPFSMVATGAGFIFFWSAEGILGTLLDENGVITDTSVSLISDIRGYQLSPLAAPTADGCFLAWVDSRVAASYNPEIVIPNVYGTRLVLE